MSGLIPVCVHVVFQTLLLLLPIFLSFNYVASPISFRLDYNKRRHMAEQTEFLELVSSAGLVCCRFNYLHSQVDNETIVQWK